MVKLHITAELLRERGACNDQVALFERHYPEGVKIKRSGKKLQQWLDEASRLGLDAEWAAKEFRLTCLSQEWHPNGRLRWSCEFVDGKRHGLSLHWSLDGQTRVFCDYIYGNKGSLWREWYENDRVSAYIESYTPKTRK